jgi:hypothetical protein
MSLTASVGIGVGVGERVLRFEVCVFAKAIKWKNIFPYYNIDF